MTTPLPSTVATEVLLLPHEPPLVASLRVIAEPAHTLVVAAVIVPADGTVLTVSDVVVAIVPQAFDNV